MSDGEEYDLPKIISIKIDTTCLDEDEIAALRVIYMRDRSKLPFTLPRIMSWPSKERANDKRAMILIKNGYLDLIEKSSSERNLDTSVHLQLEDRTLNQKELEPRIKF